MKRSMTLRSYLGWQRYWDFEPWGSFRDNLHAALVAREVRRPHIRRGSKVSLDQFMVKSPATRRKESEQNLFSMLKTVANAVTPEEAERRRKRRKQKRGKKR